MYELPDVPEREHKKEKDNKEMTLASCRAGLLTNIRDSSKEREEKKDRPKEEVKPPKFDLIFRNPKAKDCGLRLDGTVPPFLPRDSVEERCIMFHFYTQY